MCVCVWGGGGVREGLRRREEGETRKETLRWIMWLHRQLPKRGEGKGKGEEMGEGEGMRGEEKGGGRGRGQGRRHCGGLCGSI